MSVYDILGSLVADITPEPQPYPSYSRVYTDISDSLTFERKIITTSGISDNTTHLLAVLPNSGNVEVRFASSRGQFAIYKKASGGTITMLRDYDWWTYRYVGDESSTYYVCLIYVLDYASQTLLPQAGKIICRYYLFNDIGTYYDGKTPSSLFGKTIAVIGDSIVQGRFAKYGTTLNQQCMKSFTQLICEQMGCETANFGVGGALVYNSDIKSLYANCTDVTGFDVVIVCGGTNDYGGNVSEANFKTAYEYVVDTLLANNTSVIVATPVMRTNRTAANTQGLKLVDYANFEIGIAQAKSLQYIDLYSLTNTDQFKSHLPDGLHPDEIGHAIIAHTIINNAT